MRRRTRFVSNNRGIAEVEFALLLPFMLGFMLLLAELVHLGRGYMRVQNAAAQIGQIVSQCERIGSGTPGDNSELKAIALELLDGFSGTDWTMRIRAYGKNASGTVIEWTIDEGSTGRTVTADAIEAVPTGIALQNNRMYFRTQIIAKIDRFALSRNNSALRNIMTFPEIETVKAVSATITRSTRVADLTMQSGRLCT